MQFGRHNALQEFGYAESAFLKQRLDGKQRLGYGAGVLRLYGIGEAQDRENRILGRAGAAYTTFSALLHLYRLVEYGVFRVYV